MKIQSSRLGPNYTRLWLASAVSNLGDGVRLTALPLLAATLTRSPGAVAGVSLAMGLPWLLFALLGGVVVDRVDRRLLMAGVQAARMVLMAVLASLVVVGAVGMNVLYGIAFLLGIAEVLFDNAAQAAMPSIVRRDQLERANGRLYAAELVANQFAGPPLGGFLFAVVAAAPFVVDSVTFAAAALLIFAMSGRFRPVVEVDRPPTTIWAEIGEGLTWLWRHRLLRTLAMMVGTSNMMTTAWFSIFVLFALEILGVSGTGFGVLLALGAVGSLLASLTSDRVKRTIGDAPALYLSVGLFAVGALVTGLTSSPVVVGSMGVLIGFGIILWNVITVSLRQAIVPDRLLGRVNSVYRLLAWGTMPVGAALGGVLGEFLGLRAPFVVAGIVTALMGVAALPFVNATSLAAARAET